MIRKLILKNWKCHLSSELEFTLGTNALLGVMGAGKSSVLDAISFALFGTFPALHQRKLKLEDVIMKKPVKKDYAEVELEFEFEGNIYTIKRRIEKRKSTQAELRINNKLVEAQPQRVNEFIENVLKMDFDLFTRAIYSEQNRIDAFLTLPKGQRLKKIDEILKLEKFEQARASVVSLINRFKSHLLELSRFISTLSSEISEEELETIEREIKEIESSFTELENKARSLESVSGEIEKERKELLKMRSRKELLEKFLHRVKGEIELLEKEIRGKKLVSLNEIRNNISSLSKNISEAEKAIAEMETTLKELEKKKNEKLLILKEIEKNKERFEILKREIDELEAKIRENAHVTEDLEKSKLTLEENRKEFFSYITRIKEIEKSIEELSKAKELCPVCDSELPENKRKELMNKKRGELKKLDAKRKEIKTRIEEEEKKILELEKTFLNLKRWKERLDELSKELAAIKENVAKEEEIRKEYGAFEDEIKKIKSKKESKEKILQELKVKLEKEKMLEKEAIELENKKKQLENKKLEEKRHESELREITKVFSEEKLEELTEKSRKIYGELNAVRTKLMEIKKLKEEKVKRVHEIRKKLSDLKRYENEKLAVEKVISDLEKFREALSNTQIELRKNFISAVNQAMQAIWEELYPYGDFQSIRLHVSEGDYVLQLQELDGSWVSAEHVSGGERTLAALTLRIAFALVLAPQLRWLILDEPTHNLDIKAREELARVLRERITEFIDQVFLITHDPVLEDAVSGMLYRIEREKEKNGVAKVVKIAEK